MKTLLRNYTYNLVILRNLVYVLQLTKKAVCYLYMYTHIKYIFQISFTLLWISVTIFVYMLLLFTLCAAGLFTTCMSNIVIVTALVMVL